MSDSHESKDVWKSICQTIVPGKKGTGFLVGPDTILTCAHCLGSKDNYSKDVSLYFSRWPEGQREVLSICEQINWEHDFAVLKLKDAKAERWLSLTKAKKGADWSLYGHPKSVGKDGAVLGGKILDLNARAYGKPVLQLEVPPMNESDSVQGASGSPILVEGQVVGMLTQQLLKRTPDTSEPQSSLSTVYALPSQRITEPTGLRLRRAKLTFKQLGGALFAIAALVVAVLYWMAPPNYQVVKEDLQLWTLSLPGNMKKKVGDHWLVYSERDSSEVALLQLVEKSSTPSQWSAKPLYWNTKIKCTFQKCSLRSRKQEGPPSRLKSHPWILLKKTPKGVFELDFPKAMEKGLSERFVVYQQYLQKHTSKPVGVISLNKKGSKQILTRTHWDRKVAGEHRIWFARPLDSCA